MHYYMPPLCMVVELMTDGFTSTDILSFMVGRSKEAATLPFIARRESTGFIYNRLWAAVKREVLTILAGGISTPEEIDLIWKETFVKGALMSSETMPCQTLPCQMMDYIGLETVASIEKNYTEERGLDPEKTVTFLQKNYLDQGKSGSRSENGGLYPK